MVCVCVCDFRSCRSIKPNLLTFPVILFPSHANPSSISITKLRYGLKNMANNRQERNMLYQNLQLGDFWILIMPRRVWWWTPKPLNKGREEKRLLPAEIDEKVLEMIQNMHNAGEPFWKRVGVLLNSLLDDVKVSSKH